jgi:SAM-dependent methyltransferase
MKMDTSHYKRMTCRLCDESRLNLIVPFGASPIGGAFVTKESFGNPQELYQLDLYQCHACGHVQLLDVVSPNLLFGDYSYFSGRTGLVKHFAQYADSVMAREDLLAGSFVVDVGSNDGAFLKFFRDKGMRVLGVDPATNVAEFANALGIETLPLMFDMAVASRIRSEYGPADIITANNVFAHTDDMQGMLDSVRNILSDEGLFYFEVSYLVDVIDKMLLGAIFHEHLCYHTVKSLALFLKRHDMELIDVERVPIQGGSLICIVQHLGGKRKVASSVEELIDLEESRGVYQEGFFRPFCEQLDRVKSVLQSLIADISVRSERIAAYGAARGGTFITYLFELGHHIEYIVDDDPSKYGLFSPGFHIPVLPVGTLYERQPDYVIILAWVHSKSIIEKNHKYLELGGKFIIFFPSIKVVDKQTPER